MSETRELITEATSSTAATSSTHQETRDRILDAAESLFAEDGFQAVSLRQITGAAGVNVAAVNYHFGSREALIAEVMGRVLEPINRERIRLLDAAEAEAGEAPVAVEKIFEAAFRPVVVEMPGSHEEKHRFLRLAGQCLNERSEQFPETMQRVFREVTDRFISAFQRSLPHLSEADIYWRMHFAIGTLLYTITQDQQLVVISKGKIKAIHPDETMAQLLAFSVAGMKAPAPTVYQSQKAGSSKVLAIGLLALVGLFGASCAATPPPDAKPLAEVGEVPSKWKAGGHGQSDAKNPIVLADRNWVSSFGDKKLEELVDSALVHNKDLAAAAARLEISEANARIAGANLQPMAKGSFRGSRQKRNFIGFPFGGDSASGGGSDSSSVFSNLNNEFGLSLDLSWEIDLWGRIRAGQSAAISESQAVGADKAAAELSIAGQVAKAWFLMQEAQAQVALAESTVGGFQDTEKAIRDRFEAGINDGAQNLSSQLRLAMVDVETGKEALEQRRELVEKTARQIELLLGRYPSGELKGSGRLPDIPSAPPAGMPADILDRRPDLHASERRLAAADRRMLEAKRALLPTISLTGSPGTSSEQVEDLLDRNFSIWSLAGSAVQPILNGGVLRQGVKLKKAEIKQAAAEFEKTALTAFGEVENALAAEGFLAKRQSSLEKAAKLAEEAYQSASEEFTDGTGDVLTMLTAQQRLFLQRGQLITIKRLRLENRVDLHLALGGGFVKPTAATESPDEA